MNPFLSEHMSWSALALAGSSIVIHCLCEDARRRTNGHEEAERAHVDAQDRRDRPAVEQGRDAQEGAVAAEGDDKVYSTRQEWNLGCAGWWGGEGAKARWTGGWGGVASGGRQVACGRRTRRGEAKNA